MKNKASPASPAKELNLLLPNFHSIWSRFNLNILPILDGVVKHLSAVIS